MSLLPDIRKMLLVTDHNIAQLDGVQQIHALPGKHYPQVSVIGNVPAKPTHHDARQLMDTPGDVFFDVAAGIGGGSALGMVKLLSVLRHPQSPGPDVLFTGERPAQRVQSQSIPTTTGTGSEAMPNAALTVPGQSTKMGIISQVLLPDCVALFPELTISISAHITASTGINALCHLLECFTVTVVNPVSGDAALTGLSKLFRHVQLAVNDPQDPCARLEMLWASYYGGVAITHAGTHLIHAFSYPLGGKYRLPHGVVNTILPTPCMAFVRPQTIEKFARVRNCIPDAEIAPSVEEKFHALVIWLQALANQLKLPNNLATLGVPPEDTAPLGEVALNVKRLTNSVPCQIDLQDTQAIYQTLFPQHPFKG